MPIIDIICYFILLSLLFILARVRPLARVVLKIGGEEPFGKILLCDYGLGGRVGLLNTPALAVGDGILLMGTKKITMQGMHFPIDLVFLDEAKRVIGKESSVLPSRKHVKGPKGTRCILELGEGTISQRLSNIETLDTVEVTRWQP